jgi:transposase
MEKPDVSYKVERLDHLGIVAGVCQQIGLAEFLDEQETRGSRQRVSVGTATLAMVLNGLGFTNRRLYLVPRFFENKPIERLVGREDIKAEDLNDDCLGRTLDWLYAHDVTRLFAGIARRAREVFDFERSSRYLHVDTTSFSVSGEYDEYDEAVICITHGYSRDHRSDLKQWMLALGTTGEGEIPSFMRPLDGNSSDKVTLVDAVEALQEQLRAAEDDDAGDNGEDEPIFVADSGLYSEKNMLRLAQAGVHWVSRVPETSNMARSIIDPYAPDWQQSSSEEDGAAQLRWYRREVRLPLSGGEEEEEEEEEGRLERWVVVSSEAAEERARKTLLGKIAKERKRWEKALRRLARRKFACEADARGALTEETERLPAYFEVKASFEVTLHYDTPGRPGNDQQPTSKSWRVTEGELSVIEEEVEREWRRRACYIVGTNVLDPEALSEEDLIASYKGQGSVERGFRFLKDPLFSASTFYVRKPERLVALSFIMVVCLLVYRLAEHRLRSRLAQSSESIPNQVDKPTARPTMRWVFQLFEGIEVLIIHSSATGIGAIQRVLGVEPVHAKILRFLGPIFQKIYEAPT